MGTFKIDGDSFLLNDEKFNIYSGGMHYFRMLPEYWEDRLKKLKAAGFNTVETYVPWNLHEPREGEFCFSGGLDIAKFITIAKNIGLYVILRPGPYICAEWDFGGLPAWLLKDANMRVRCCYPPYLNCVENFFSKLLPLLTPHQITEGGNIIAMQIENEYGSYSNDKEYLKFLENLLRSHNVEVLLFTSDGPESDMLSGGTLPHIFKTANFGSLSKIQLNKLRKFQPSGPLMCMEFWLGWFDHWGDRRHHKRSSKRVALEIKSMLSNGYSFNLYLFYGGTNFGFMSGANLSDKYYPDVTSYDYDALLTEYGGYTKKYFAIAKLLREYQGLPPMEYPKTTVLQNIGMINLTEETSLFDNLEYIGEKFNSVTAEYMEHFGQNYGLILYTHTVIGHYHKTTVSIDGIHDRGYVYINGKFKGLTDRNNNKPIQTGALKTGDMISVLVEGMGRVNYGTNLYDRKGASNIRVNNQILTNLSIVTLSLDNISKVDYSLNSKTFPIFLKGTFHAEPMKDCFVEMKGFKKGFVWINGFNLGRYWEIGPQKTLYLPGSLLHENNEIVILELEGYEKPQIFITDRHKL
ncbi:MAG: beta-galactosidase [Christensenellaceae bacterium]|jgi:beta-galactosidase|nr:beta-galactosidase [Christensenellaceae bacterium]